MANNKTGGRRPMSKSAVYTELANETGLNRRQVSEVCDAPPRLRPPCRAHLLPRPARRVPAMTPQPRAVLLAGLALLTGLAAPARGDAGGAGEKKIRVILVDGQNNHDWRSTTPLLKKMLEDT